MVRIIPAVVPGKMVEQILLEAMSRHMKERKMTGNSQHGLTKGKSCLTSPIVFFDEVTGSENKRRPLARL